MKTDNVSSSFLIQVSQGDGRYRVRVRDLGRGTVREYGNVSEVVQLIEGLTAPADGHDESDSGSQSGPAPR